MKYTAHQSGSMITNLPQSVLIKLNLLSNLQITMSHNHPTNWQSHCSNKTCRFISVLKKTQ